MRRSKGNLAHTSLNSAQRLREAALLLLCDPLPECCLRLAMLSKAEWQRLLRWLDIAGLALYFLDRISELNLLGMLPPFVLARLQQNLADNTERMLGMMEESTAIHQAFQSAGISYVALKGFSLWPTSVPKLELRSQLDLDFLIAKTDIYEAQRILEYRGYYLHAVSGRSWEFKTNQMPDTSLKNIYKPTPYLSVELHAEHSGPDKPSLLVRAERRIIHGISMPVLAPVDLFLGQGMHLYKHLSNDFVRPAHLIEFRRHMLAQQSERQFWTKLQIAAEENPNASFALGVATLLITKLMGDFAPKQFTSWTVNLLPSFARIWVEMYGARLIFTDFPGSKLHLLLQSELEAAGVPTKLSRRRALLPLRLPPAVVKAPAQENLPARIRRYYGQTRFIFLRLRFHVVGGFSYLIELRRWRKCKSGLCHSGSSPLHASLHVNLQCDSQQALSSSTKE